MADEDLPSLHVGDHVTDREDDDAPMLVVGRSPQPAAHYSIGDGQTVADVNPEYPPEDHVFEVVYPERGTVDVPSLEAYAFPRGRLKLTTPIHDRDPSEVTMLSGDSEIVECVACGRTGIKARIQPTACPHDCLDDVEGEN